ncbi:MAG: glycosyltransferase [Verrucomicrobia bacterium]|nr:glycosyltransferase [Verrucomicrobiota bacterium]
MIRWLHRSRVEARDRLRNAAALQRLAGFLRLGKARLAPSLPARLNLLADSYRLLLATGRPDAAEKKLRPFVEDPPRAAVWRDERIGWARFGRPFEPGVLTKSIVLKPCLGPREKGVLLLSFEYNLPPLLTAPRVKELLRDYTIICATSWSPTQFQAVWAAAHLPDADVFFMLSNARDAEWWGRLNSGTFTMPLFISSWISPADYQPRPKDERAIDILMVANWAPFKRHWVLFKALCQMRRKLRVVLVGQPEAGRTPEHVMAEAEAFGVREQIEFRSRLPIGEVTALQCASKVSLVLSRREGSCVVVTESLFADTPVGLLRGTHMGSASYINPQTGVFLDEANLAAELGAFLDRHEQFAPRPWAVENISGPVSTRRRNDVLRTHALQRGQEWTRDICPLGIRPNPRHVNPDDEKRMLPVQAGMGEKYGIRFA